MTEALMNFASPVTFRRSMPGDPKAQPLLLDAPVEESPRKQERSTTMVHFGQEPEPQVPLSRGPRLAAAFGLRSEEEFWKVFLFMVAAFNGNAFFVIARNVGAVLFLAHIGPDYLTTAVFWSGIASVVVGQQFSSFSRGRSPALVNSWLLFVAGVLLTGFYFATLMTPDGLPEEGMSRTLVFATYFGVYLVEDIFSMFVAMQCASVAQASFSVGDAKRLFGLVQLGNSFAAMAVGITIGSVADLVGTEQLLIIQAVLAMISIFINTYIGNKYVDPTSWGGKKRSKGQAPSNSGTPGQGSGDQWWKNLLVLAMGFWSFTIMFTKTMYEYEYNVLVATSMSPSEMVALTGYLYAGAGVASTIINVWGTKVCLEKLGMQGAILATPAALLSVSFAILASPSVATTFLGRLADLSLRWSLNNTVRTVLWIAVPPQQAAAAKPWVEGTIKKMGQAFNAVVIMVALWLSQIFLGRESLGVLSFLSLLFCTFLFLSCLNVYALYLNSMMARIKRRELQGESLPFDVNLDMQVLDRLMNGGQATQIAILHHMRDSFSPQYWEEFFARFYELPAAVQVKILELGRKQHERVPNEFLLSLLTYRDIEASVLQVAVVMVGERRLRSATKHLQGFLSHPRPVVRAAAAVSIINIGWGVGLGEISSVSTLLLESMLGERLGGHLPSDNREGSLQAAFTVLEARGCSVSLDGDPRQALEEHLGTMQSEWEAAIEKRDSARALMLAVQVTQVRLAIAGAAGNRIGRSQSAGNRMDTPLGSRPVEKLALGAVAAASEMAEVFWDESQDSPERCEQIAAALHMMAFVTDHRALLSPEVCVHFLTHANPKVRMSALALVREDDMQGRGPGMPSTLKLLVMNLQDAETYAAAEAALARLRLDQRVFEQVLEDFKHQLARHKVLALSEHQHPAYISANLRMMGLLKYLQRQCTRVSKSDFEFLWSTGICDRLLTASTSIYDPEVLQELYMAMVDLKDRGCQVSRSLAEARIYRVAETMCKGLSVQRWMKHRCEMFSKSQLRLLRLYLELPNSSSCETVVNPTKSLDKSGGIHSFTDAELVSAVDKIGQSYVSEHIYLQRLQLLYLAILIAPPSPDAYRATRVLAAWRVLRSKDAASEAAVIEVLDSMLPSHLKGVVLPLLDSSPLDSKLAVADEIPGGDAAQVIWTTASRPPPWAVDWFKSSLSVFGMQFFTMLTQMAAFRPSDQLPQEAIENTLLPKMFLISRMDLYSGLLSIHLAELAEISSVRPCKKGKIKCQKGETYIIAEGKFHVPLTHQDLNEGDVIQELHAICKELPPLEIECTSPGGGVVVCIAWQKLFELMSRLTPKFALGILRNLVRTLPAPESVGGSRTSRPGGFAPMLRMRLNTATNLDDKASSKDKAVQWRPPGSEDLAELARVHSEAEIEHHSSEKAEGEEVETAADSVEDHRSNHDIHGDGDQWQEGVLIAKRKRVSRRDSISLLEKLVVLQEVKMFRYVPTEYLPDLAKCSEGIFKERGAALCVEGEPTDARLYIVIDGSLGLFTRSTEDGGDGGDGGAPRDAGRLLRTLTAGDTMGNTALLTDAQWPYSAIAVEDSWLLCISRANLTDVLRGRRDLAAAVIHGLYKTFTRRMKNAVYAPRDSGSSV